MLESVPFKFMSFPESQNVTCFGNRVVVRHAQRKDGHMKKQREGHVPAEAELAGL